MLQGDNNNDNSPQYPSPDLTRRLLLQRHPNQRISNDAVELANEMLRIFIVEARERAAVEAECDEQMNAVNESSRNNTSNGDDAVFDEDQNTLESNMNTSKQITQIRGEHVFRIAAELLMEFS